MKLQNPQSRPALPVVATENIDHMAALLSATCLPARLSRGALFRRLFQTSCRLGLLGECDVSVSGPLPPARPVHVKQFLAYQVRLPLTALCLAVGVILTLFSLPRIVPGSTLNHLLIGAGYLVLLLGILLRIWSITHIQQRKSISLVTSGPYSLSRNPLYLGTLLIVTGYLLMVQSFTLVCCCLPVLALYAWGVVPAEEQVLFSRHGESYRDFCRQVPRWFPSPGRLCWGVSGGALQKIRQIQSLRRADLVSSMKEIIRGRGTTASGSWSSAVRREIECGGWWVLVGLLVHLVCSQRLADWWSHPLLWP